MKKLLTFLMVGLLAFTMVACTVNTTENNDSISVEDGDNTTETENGSNEESTSQDESTDADENTSTEDEASQDESTDVDENTSTEDETSQDESTDVDENTSTEDETSQDESTDLSEMTLEAIIDMIYAQSGLEMPRTMKEPLSAENMVYMLGVDNFEYLEGLTSAPMMGSIPHSIVLFTVEEGADIETIKADIKANVDGRKWICVGVEPEDIQVENVGNHIILIMDHESEKFVEAFYSVMQ